MSLTHTVGELNKLMNETGTGGILILDGDEKLVGIVTTRDLLFENDAAKPLSEIMQKKVISASPDITLKDAERLLHDHRIEKLPLVNKDGRVAGLVTLKDIMKITNIPKPQKICADV